MRSLHDLNEVVRTLQHKTFMLKQDARYNGLSKEVIGAHGDTKHLPQLFAAVLGCQSLLEATITGRRPQTGRLP